MFFFQEMQVGKRGKQHQFDAKFCKLPEIAQRGRKSSLYFHPSEKKTFLLLKNK